MFCGVPVTWDVLTGIRFRHTVKEAIFKGGAVHVQFDGPDDQFRFIQI